MLSKEQANKQLKNINHLNEVIAYHLAGRPFQDPVLFAQVDLEHKSGDHEERFYSDQSGILERVSQHQYEQGLHLHTCTENCYLKHN